MKRFIKKNNYLLQRKEANKKGCKRSTEDRSADENRTDKFLDYAYALGTRFYSVSTEASEHDRNRRDDDVGIGQSRTRNRRNGARRCVECWFADDR